MAGYLLLVGIAVVFAGCDARRPADSDVMITPRNGLQHDGSAESPGEPSVTPRISLDSTLAIRPAFADVARKVGMEFQFYSDTIPDRFFLPEVMGGGAVWFDFDRDDVLDVYLMNGSRLDPNASDASRHVNNLFRQNSAGQFRQVSDECGAADDGYGQGCAAGDFNSDGFPDLYLGNFGPNTLLVNNGDGTFLDVSALAGVDDPLWTSSVIWHDIDGDQDLDLYVTNYLDVTLENIQVCDYEGQRGYCGPGTYEAAPDHVFLNDSNGTFTEASEQLGLTGENGKGLAIVAADFDGDFQSEIYVGNDMTPNFLFTRVAATEPVVRYRDEAVTAGCAQSGEGMNEASMGIACADFDGDARYDLYLTHYYQMKNTFYRNLGRLMFDDASLRLGSAGTGYEYLGFGTAPLDFDRDGWQDLFITNGHVLGPNNPPYRMSGQLLHNAGGRRFDDVSHNAGPYFRRELLGRGVAAADFDMDGDTDLLVTHIDAPVALLRNDTSAGGCFIGFDLRTEARISPVGARIRVQAGDLVREQAVIAGGSYLCGQDQRLLFGWTTAHDTVDVEIAWPSGTHERVPGLGVNRYWVLQEGDAPR